MSARNWSAFGRISGAKRGNKKKKEKMGKQYQWGKEKPIMYRRARMAATSERRAKECLTLGET